MEKKYANLQELMEIINMKTSISMEPKITPMPSYAFPSYTFTIGAGAGPAVSFPKTGFEPLDAAIGMMTDEGYAYFGMDLFQQIENAIPNFYAHTTDSIDGGRLSYVVQVKPDGPLYWVRHSVSHDAKISKGPDVFNKYAQVQYNYNALELSTDYEKMVVAKNLKQAVDSLNRDVGEKLKMVDIIKGHSPNLAKAMKIDRKSNEKLDTAKKNYNKFLKKYGIKAKNVG